MLQVVTVGGLKGEEEESHGKITLSGLLNTIDGVATHERRCIFMTINCPDELDPALIPPGRIDRHVKLGLTTRQQMAEIFLSVYSSGEPNSYIRERCEGGNTLFTNVCTRQDQKVRNANSSISHACREIKNTKERRSDVPGIDMCRLRQLSEQFSSCIAEGKFLPAEVQGYLLLEEYRHDPANAIRNTGTWVDERLAERGSLETKTDECQESDDLAHSPTPKIFFGLWSTR